MLAPELPGSPQGSVYRQAQIPISDGACISTSLLSPTNRPEYSSYTESADDDSNGPVPRVQPRRPPGTNAILGNAGSLLAASHVSELLFQLYPDRRLVTRSIIVLPTLEPTLSRVTSAFSLVTGGSSLPQYSILYYLSFACLLCSLSSFVSQITAITPLTRPSKPENMGDISSLLSLP